MFQYNCLYLPVDLAKSTSIAANKRASIVENRVERIKDLNGQMQSSVRDLKNKILLARQKASSVSKNTLFIYKKSINKNKHCSSIFMFFLSIFFILSLFLFTKYEFGLISSRVFSIYFHGSGGGVGGFIKARLWPSLTRPRFLRRCHSNQFRNCQR